MRMPAFGKSVTILALGLAALSAPAFAQEAIRLADHLRTGLQGPARQACLTRYGALEKELISGFGLAPGVVRAQSANQFLAQKFRYTLMQDGRTSRLALPPSDEADECVGKGCAPWDAMRSHGAPFDGGSQVFHCPLSARQIYVFKDACREKSGQPLKALAHTSVYLDARPRKGRSASALTEVSGLEKTFRGQEIVVDRLAARAQAPLGADGVRHELFVFGPTKINGKPADIFLEEFLPEACQRPRSVGPVFTPVNEAPAAVAAAAGGAR